MYLSTIMDAFNRQIISYVVSNLSDEDSKTSNERTKSKRCHSLHRPRKCLYYEGISIVCQTKRHYHQHIPEGNFHDNAIMESFFAHLKADFLLTKIARVFNTAVRKVVLEYIHYYNCVRIQENQTTYP